MKYTSEIGIDLPVSRVVEIFDNPEYLKHWQPGLISFEHLSGVAGRPGAKSRLKYKIGKRAIEMIETITVRNLPHEFAGTYEAKGVYNIISNKFIPLSENRTRYITESEFRFRGFMRLVAFFMPGAFKKQSRKYLQDFKRFAEGLNRS